MSLTQHVPGLRLLKNKSPVNLLFIAVTALIIVQLVELGLTIAGTQTLPVRIFWLLSTALTFSIAALMLLARTIVARETARTDAIAEYLNDGLLFVEGGRATYANALGRRLIGASNVPAEIGATVRSVLDEADRSNLPALYETQLDGRAQHFLVSVAQLPLNPATRLERQMYVFQDVTFLRENEEAKVNFIGALSHEIKTPVTSLAMALAMLDRTGYDPELVRIANADVGRLRVLLDDLLNVSRLKIVRNPNALHKRASSMTALLHQTIKTAGTLAERKSVRLVNRLQLLGTVTASVDPTKMSWVFSTLLTDAIRQTPPGGDVTLVSEVDGTRVHYEIHYQRRLDSLGPTGHAIVRDIVEAHAGRFTSLHRADSRSVFKVSIHAQVNNGNRGKTA
ncbi:MAG: hypothetical protein HY075_01725 [Deltaproteobacteria bacterium]|nr:hypothetical protein [Deltaproteobacteria bacterium]